MKEDLNFTEAFHKESYDRHNEWYNQLFPGDETKRNLIRRNQSLPVNNINNWLQNLFFKCLDPLLSNKQSKWLTVGDAYGYDANYIISAGSKNTVASDLNGDFLKISAEEGLISDYSPQNAENLTFRDDAFDYVLCKESYHHFPRPYAALYEMVRVAQKAIIVIEPHDPVSKMPALLWITNMLSAIGPRYIDKVWKNRFSYEKVGNFVYKVSEREFEKFAAGLGLPMVAFKKINSNFWQEGIENYLAVPTEKRFNKIVRKKKLLDLLVRFRMIPGQVLSTIVFKSLPDENVLSGLKENGYQIVHIPKNPYR